MCANFAADASLPGHQPHVEYEHAHGSDSVRLQWDEMRQLEHLFERQVLLGLRRTHATLASPHSVFDHQTRGGIEQEACVEDVAPSGFGQRQSPGIGCNWKRVNTPCLGEDCPCSPKYCAVVNRGFFNSPARQPASTTLRGHVVSRGCSAAACGPSVRKIQHQVIRPVQLLTRCVANTNFL